MVHNNMLLSHYRIALDLLHQANIHREENNVVGLYVTLLRFSNLFAAIDNISFHRDFQASLPKKERAAYMKRWLAALYELESLKPELEKFYGLNGLQGCAQFPDSDGQTSKSTKLDDKYKDQKHKENSSKERGVNHEKCKGKSTSEINLSNCDPCNPSYRCVPDNCPIPVLNRRSELDVEVLNDNWELIKPEHVSFKHRTKNKYEERMLACGEDQFELDLLIHRARSASERIRHIMLKIEKEGIEIPFILEKHFSALHRKCIQSVYDLHDRDIMEKLCQNPTFVLPIILRRLEQKEEEWMKNHSELNKVWAGVYAKNFHKSLDNGRPRKTQRTW